MTKATNSKSKRKVTASKSTFILDSSSETSSEDNEEEVDMQQRNGEICLDCRVSVDSRLDSGNEDYELDDFVVDSGVSSVSEYGSEITITSSTSSLTSDESGCKEREERKSSEASTASTGLFVSDPTSTSPSALSSTCLPVTCDDFSPADVAEEINDAIIRCVCGKEF